MENLQNLIKAFNAFDNKTEKISFRSDGVKVYSHDATGKMISEYKIKARPVAGKDGIEVWQYVARQGQDE